MRFLAAIPLLLLPLAASAAPGELRIERFKMPGAPDQLARAAPAACADFMRWARGRDGAVLTEPPARPERLGALPPGDLVLTVMRSAPDGCFAPVIVREGYGGPAFRNGQPRRR